MEGLAGAVALLITLLVAAAARNFVGRRLTDEGLPGSNRSHIFSADRPISDASADRLGRARFAAAIADAIASWQGRDSLVLGLYGQWGAGKTSIMNLVAARLRAIEPKVVTIVPFNPWEWIDHRDLAVAFFGELSTAVGRGENPVRAARLAAALSSYATVLSIGSDAMKGVRALYALLLLGFVAGLGLTASGGPTRVVGYLLSGAAALTMLATLLSDALRQLAGHYLNRANPDQTALGEWKDRLRAELSRSPQTYLVLIDDVDRLPPVDILRVFQLVKANADFPNLVYLMPFEREVITAAVERIHGGTGNDFLEKIVQIGFNVPYPGRSQIEQLLFGEIDHALATSGDATERFELSRSTWIELYQAGLVSYIETPRDATRYVASLAFTLSLLTIGGAVEVDPVDLIAVEVLRLFEPDLYEAIALARDLLTTDRVTGMPHGLDAQRARLDALLATVPADRRDRASEIMVILFPAAREVFGKPAIGDNTARWRALRRVGHGEMFERYFRFELLTGQASRVQIRAILAQPNAEEILDGLTSVLTEGLMDSFIKSLRVSVDEMPVESRQPLITALCVIGEELSSRSAGFLDISPSLNASFLVMDLVQLLPDSAQRTAALRDAFERAAARGAIYLPAYVVGLLDQRHERQRDAVIDQQDLEPLGQLIAEKIGEAADTRSLLASGHLDQLIYWWSNWDAASAKTWIKSAIATQRGVVRLTSALESRFRTSEDSGARDHAYFPFDQIETLVSIGDLERAVTAARDEQINASGVAEPVLERFQKARAEFREGTYRDPRHPG